VEIQANPGLKVFEAGDEAFLDYGRPLDILGAADLDSLVELADRIIAVDPQGNRYVASEPELEAHPVSRLLAAVLGCQDTQVGWCAGPNSLLNGLEYHKSSELLVAVTDLASRAPQNWYARQAAQPPAAGKPTVQG